MLLRKGCLRVPHEMRVRWIMTEQNVAPSGALTPVYKGHLELVDGSSGYRGQEMHPNGLKDAAGKHAQRHFYTLYIRAAIRLRRAAPPPRVIFSLILQHAVIHRQNCFNGRSISSSKASLLVRCCVSSFTGSAAPPAEPK